MTPDPQEWVVVLAVKALAAAKSRMAPALTADERADLVLAMAGDVVDAALACSLVERCVVVTPDARVAARLAGDRVDVVLERAALGLNEAYRLGRQRAVPLGGAPLALLMADLPFLLPGELTGMLRAVRADRAHVVADSAGTGTTMLAARQAHLLHPRFGPDSFASHRATGADDATPFVGPGLRCDVDDIAALSGSRPAGRRTAEWLTRRAAHRAEVALFGSALTHRANRAVATA